MKRKTNGGVQFSRDPLNLTNKHSRKVHIQPDPASPLSSPTRSSRYAQILTLSKQYSSLANSRAIGIKAGPDNTVVVSTKVAKNANKPAKAVHTSTFKASTPSRKLYRSVVNSTVKKGYRQDLLEDAVKRASTVKHTAKEVKPAAEPKLRGKKALAKASSETA